MVYPLAGRSLSECKVIHMASRPQTVSRPPAPKHHEYDGDEQIPPSIEEDEDGPSASDDEFKLDDIEEDEEDEDAEPVDEEGKEDDDDESDDEDFDDDRDDEEDEVEEETETETESELDPT